MEIMHPERQTDPEAKGIGTSSRRPDSDAKVRGEFEYAPDLSKDDMLWGATLRSPHALARIRRVNLNPAKAMSGVHAVLGAWDVPMNLCGAVNHDTPILADDWVRYVGEPVAVVAAETPALARRAAAAIAVEYEPETPVTDALEALRAGKVFRRVAFTCGDPSVVGEVQVEGEYITPRQDHSFLAPDAGIARIDGNGGVVLTGATQWVHADREQIAACLAMPEEKVLVVNSGVGGSFGGRVSMTWQVHAALLALQTGRPVKFVYSRKETFLARYHRHPSRIWVRHHANRDGTLVKLEARILLEDGPYSHTAASGIGNSCSFIQGPYQIPNADIQGWAVATNNGMCGSMRGFGVVEPIFACEANLDKLARTLKMDGAALRCKNAMKTGDQWTFGQLQEGPAPVADLIDACQAMPLPPELKTDALLAPARVPGGLASPTRGKDIRRGVSVSAAAKNTGMSEACPVNTTAMISLHDGVATVECAAAEVGQGFITCAIQIVQTALGVNTVRLGGCDTTMPPACTTDAQEQTMTSGPAVYLAAARLKERFLTFYGHEHDVDPATLDVRDDYVVSAADGSRLARVAEAGMGLVFRATERFDQRQTWPLNEVDATHPAHVALTFSANRCVVDVDPELGLARVVQMDVAQYGGRIVNPVQAHGQIAGGSLMGLGFALSESLDYTDGQPANGDWGGYLIPTLADAPLVNCEFLDLLEPGIPQGFNGIAEIPHVQAPAAVLAALRAATGHELPRAPATPARIAQVEKTEPMRLGDVGMKAHSGTADVRIGKSLRFQLVKEA
jgi:CO/xanthine dehydrogenase Mo-binding subunit